MKQQSAFLLNILLAAAAFSLFSKQTYALAAMNSFTSGQAAVAADVNTNFTTLYNALTNATNSINVDGWANASGNLGYTGGNIGVGIASPLAKFQVSGGSAVALTAGTGFGVFGVTTSSHIAIDTNQIQAKSNATTANALRLNPLGGNVGVGTTLPGAKFQITQTGAANTDGIRLVNGGTTHHVYSDGSGRLTVGSTTTPAALVVQDDGLVGIGAAPGAGQTLAVNGTINISSNNPLIWSGDPDKFLRYWSAGGADMGIKAGEALTLTVGSGGGAASYFFRVLATGNVRFFDAPGSLQCTIGAGSNTCTSDQRLKKNIQTIGNALPRLAQLRGVSFVWNKTGLPGLGVIAQEVQTVFPELVTVNDQGMLMVHNTGLFGPLIQGINELKSEKDAQVLALERRANDAEQKHAALQKQLQTADTRAANLEKRLSEEQFARKQQEIRLAQESAARQSQDLRLARLEKIIGSKVMALR